jgi:hypothetical protein
MARMVPTRGLHRLRLWLWADFPSSPVRAFWREGSKFQAGKTKIGEILGLDPFAFSASSRLASASTKAVIAFWNPVSCLRQARSLVHPSDFLFLRHVSVPVSSTESSRTLSVRGIIPPLEGRDDRRRSWCRRKLPSEVLVEVRRRLGLLASFWSRTLWLDSRWPRAGP